MENYEIIFCIKKMAQAVDVISIYSLKNYYNTDYKSRVSPEITQPNL
jgi:hypothetical protein